MKKCPGLFLLADHANTRHDCPTKKHTKKPVAHEKPRPQQDFLISEIYQSYISLV